jgi:hypothetical protein
MNLAILFLVFSVLVSANFVDFIGLTYLYEGMGTVSQTTLTNGSTSPTYQITDSNYKFLKNFQTLTDFCDYKCENFYNIPCFFVLDCNIQMRNFVLIILVPLLSLIILAWFCKKGWWNLGCWWYYFSILSGITFLIWVYRKIVKGQ